jgi:outer membrane protein OmpA-like peptidoglycan-associated protein
MPRWPALIALMLATPANALTLDVPQGAVLTQQTVEPIGSHALPTGPWANGALPTRTVEGEVTWQAWRLPQAGLTTLALLAPLRTALEQEGFDILLDCATAACGGFDFRFAIDVLPPPAMQIDLGDFRFLSARRDDEAVEILVSATARAGHIQIVRTGPADAAFRASATGDAPATTAEGAGPALTLPPAAAIAGDTIGGALETQGRVILSDLAFQTGSAQLGDGPFASLTALAAYLTANPNRTVALVGHTDAEGSLDANIALSRRRAGSVLERLVADYDIPRGQLAAEGMGYLSPIASNLSPAGREANRRVEVILTSTE